MDLYIIYVALLGMEINPNVSVQLSIKMSTLMPMRFNVQLFGLNPGFKYPFGNKHTGYPSFQYVTLSTSVLICEMGVTVNSVVVW